ncbi:hypothetical protein DICSQDRAFT_156285 [Dichomitus squalens LYAD-421 SS1]|uniref:SAC3/GANP/THP3 conserved domain-containing protein n=1 Tax=Dichomitus squalens (strain LYAD-421) TaxID=732165 RepID=R7ST83_DICSQ|nr:uncharacterized protein DICSQDRAFT_156285 [Dichomitus squalens LYAD-421 SS1]EJF59439.1 hypothetical protein DICSQDRAFT_156285 [Dichomitus squalens LYAD-421 SS1]
MMRIQGASDASRGRPHSRNKKWVAGQVDSQNGHATDSERWERGSQRRRGRGRGHAPAHHGTHLTVPTDVYDEGASATEDEGVSGAESAYEDELPQIEEPEHIEDREAFYKELVRQREIERKKAIVEGKMDDPNVPKRLEDAITMVGTCMDMCPRFERYRRERENNLDKWETIPGTKRVDHRRAVKIYERAAGDKTLPSDLRPPPVLKKTLDYLFHDLLMREGFSETHDFIRDRSRAVRADFTMQHETGPIAIECHDRCARYHILALHLERDNPKFVLHLEEQQLMFTLQSLKEFYDDQRGRYQSPTELEMRVYHRLIHIRDQRERHEDIPDEIRNHPVFNLTTQFRLRVQAKSAPISKTSRLVVDEEAMHIFGQLAAVLREQNNVAMIYLVACIMERLFGKDTIEDIEAIRGDLTLAEIIDGISRPLDDTQLETADEGHAYIEDAASATEEITDMDEEPEQDEQPVPAPSAYAVPPVTKSATEWLTNNFGAQPPAPTAGPSTNVFSSVSAPVGSSSSGTSAFTGLATSKPTSNTFGTTSGFGSPGSAFSTSASAPSLSGSAFGNLATKSSVFGGTTFGPVPTGTPPAPGSIFGGGSAPKSVFGASAAPPLTSQPTWATEAPNLGGQFTAPSQNTTPQAAERTPPRNASAPLNPSVPSFVPPQVSSGVASSSFAPPQPAPVVEKPSSIFSTNLFPATPAVPAGEPAKPSGSIFSIPLFPTHQPQTTSPPVQSLPPIPPDVPTEPSSPVAPEQSLPDQTQTPARSFTERRKSLWDLPGSSSPFSRLREDRMTFTPTPGNAPEPRTPISPTAGPPSLGRAPHIALPPTPTARWFDPDSQPQSLGEQSDVALSRKRSLLHFPSLTLPTTPSASEILSPIHLTTPTPGKTAPAASGGPSPLYRSHIAESVPSSEPSTSTMRPPLPKPTTPPALKPVLEIQTNGISNSAPSPTKASTSVSANGKGKAKETQADLDTKATRFLRTSTLVRSCWSRWRARMEAQHEWEEAIRRSEAYKTRVHKSELQTSFSGSSIKSLGLGAGEGGKELGKKRRISMPPDIGEAQVRRAKRRRSKQFQSPLTDEALTRRLQENREENEKRWAPGSFRKAVLDRLKARLEPGDELDDWCLWVSMNTENDKTAVWIERKLDVPASGYWVSENVFSIPAFKKPEGPGSPGLIVFERTPLEGTDDEIEKKYRVLDDCARLRDVLGFLPPLDQRRYIPCLLIITWSENEDCEKTRDLVDMTHKLVKEGTIKHVSYFKVATTVKDLDEKFASTIDITPLDVEDRLAVPLGWRDIRSLFVDPVHSAISDLLDTCWPDDEFNWVRYNQVMSAIGDILNCALRAILSLFNDTPSYVTVEIPEDVPQPGVTGRKYATGAFSEGLADLLYSSAKDLLGNRFASAPMLFPRDVVDAAQRATESAINRQVHKLRQLAADAALRASVSSSVGPSPKRRASSDDPRLNGSTSSKRVRRSPSDDGIIDVYADDTSTSPPPSISAATDMSDKPLVTVGMLRALARDVLKTYDK